MPADSIPVTYLFTMSVNLAPTVTTIANGPQGTRVLVSVAGGTVEGPKLRGTVLPGSGGDWVTLRADGTMKVDVRLTLQAEDGSPILVTYNGIGRPAEGGAFHVQAAPLFEAGTGAHAWLNSVQAVAFGVSGGGTVTYEVYALEGLPGSAG